MASANKKVRPLLVPPQFQFYNEIKYSLGVDPLVSVGPLKQVSDTLFSVTLTVDVFQKAQALATLLLREKTIGAIRIRIRLRTIRGQFVRPISSRLTSAQIETLCRRAFTSNPYFSFVSTRSFFGNTFVYPVMKRQIIQFPNDDLSDYYLNYNNVAAFVFRDIARTSINNIPVQYSTALKKK